MLPWYVEQNQETNIRTLLLSKLQTLFDFWALSIPGSNPGYHFEYIVQRFLIINSFSLPYMSI